MKLDDLQTRVVRDAAQAIGNPDRVWCRECGRSVRVDAAVAFRVGWPECHGYTMTIDHPSTWGDSDKGKTWALKGEAERQRQASTKGGAV